MPKISIDKVRAKLVFREEASAAERGPIDGTWEQKVEKLSALCDDASRTHIAFLATAMLAKSMDHRVDLYAVKPEHADPAANSFSARTLCHSVIVPLSAELGINIGVTGREPLNNQPYFRMTRLDDGTPVHANGRAAFQYMLELVEELNRLTSESAARAALRAFIFVRRKRQLHYSVSVGGASVRAERLAALITDFVRQDSENGKRAQAIVAGLLDTYAGTARVECGRINDPSRKYPGDVCVRSASDPEIWEKAFEVRDKLVTEDDVRIFGKKCVDMGVREAAVVMTSDRQVTLNGGTLNDWATSFGIGLTLFYGWAELIRQVLFWSASPKPLAAAEAARLIEQRLINIEASRAAVALWQEMISNGHETQ